MSPEKYDLYIRTKLYEDAEEIAMEEKFEKGKLEGIAEGEKKKSLEIAKNLVSQNIDIHVISLATGLTTTEIEELKS